MRRCGDEYSPSGQRNAHKRGYHYRWMEACRTPQSTARSFELSSLSSPAYIWTLHNLHKTAFVFMCNLSEHALCFTINKSVDCITCKCPFCVIPCVKHTHFFLFCWCAFVSVTPFIYQLCWASVDLNSHCHALVTVTPTSFLDQQHVIFQKRPRRCSHITWSL